MKGGNPHLLADVERIAQTRAAELTAKEIAAKHGVTPRYVRRLLKMATQRARQFLFGTLQESKSE